MVDEKEATLKLAGDKSIERIKREASATCETVQGWFSRTVQIIICITNPYILYLYGNPY